MLAQITAGIEANADAGRRRAAQIVSAANHYAGAFERKVIAEFAARMSGSTPDTREADEAALALMDLVGDLPELRAASERRPRLVESAPPAPPTVAADPTAVELPVRAWVKLRSAAAGAPLLVIGSQRATKLLPWLRQRVGRNVESVEIDHGRASIDAVEKMLRAGPWAAALVIHSAMESWQAKRLYDVARSQGVAAAIAPGGATDHISAAMDAIENELRAA